MPKLGINNNNQKKSNRGLILKLVATRQCTSRIELSRATGLTKTAISQIVNELIRGGYLVETAKESAKETTQELGRNPIGLLIAPEAPVFAGILVERNFCEAVLCNMELKILKEKRINCEWHSREELLKGIYELMDYILEGEKNVAGIGAASIGSVDIKEGVIVRPLYFHDIQNVELKRLLEERYGLPVSFDQDSQSAVLAEQLFGNGRGYEDILLVSVGRGIGSGILVDGRRIHSYTGYPPEIGHISIDYHGPECICGNNGCLECYVNSDTMLRQFQNATGLEGSYEEFCNMTEDPRVDEIMRDAAKKLGNAILSTLNILNSQIVLLCMDCCYWPEKYIQMIEEDINRRKFGNCNILVPVKKVLFMHQTHVLGAVCNILNATFNGDLFVQNCQKTI
ncbi:MAG: ROK family transcriptional regulator [Lachnospiraceae bacterium]|nr:ROK family transcriptional regulator [Lachnospiraceae bacterium]